MSIWLLHLYARLPLSIIHGLGFLAGWLHYLTSPRFGQRSRENLLISQISNDSAMIRRVLHRSIGETGKGMLETFAIWFRPYEKTLRWVRECRGWNVVESARAEGRGIIFLTPHLGCFEITSLYYAQQHPLSVMYRPPHQAWLEPLIYQGRQRGHVTLAPANLKGVKQLLQSLKQGHAVGILPDQVPSSGEGEWAKFFGKYAFTMSLVSRLAKSTNAAVILAFGERLALGRGYRVHFERIPTESVFTTDGLNQAIESLVRRYPEQYLWSYPRFKAPRGTPPIPVE